MTHMLPNDNNRPLRSTVEPAHADRRHRVALIQGSPLGRSFDLTIADDNGGFLDMAGASWGAVLARAAAWAGVGARIRIEPAGRRT